MELSFLNESICSSISLNLLETLSMYSLIAFSFSPFRRLYKMPSSFWRLLKSSGIKFLYTIRANNFSKSDLSFNPKTCLYSKQSFNVFLRTLMSVIYFDISLIKTSSNPRSLPQILPSIPKYIKSLELSAFIIGNKEMI